MRERSSIMVSMNRLDPSMRAHVISALVEGNSIRSVVRMTGVAKGTVTKLLADVGAACAEYQDRAFRNLKLRRIQCDEIWSFCYAKDKNLPDGKRDQFGFGSVWTWTALDADNISLQEGKGIILIIKADRTCLIQTDWGPHNCTVSVENFQSPGSLL